MQWKHLTIAQKSPPENPIAMKHASSPEKGKRREMKKKKKSLNKHEETINQTNCMRENCRMNQKIVGGEERKRRMIRNGSSGKKATGTASMRAK